MKCSCSVIFHQSIFIWVLLRLCFDCLSCKLFIVHLRNVTPSKFITNVPDGLRSMSWLVHYGFVYSSLSFKQNITGCLETSCCLARCLLGWWHVCSMKLKTKTNDNNKKSPLCIDVWTYSSSMEIKKVLWWYSMVQLLYGDTMVLND